MNMEDKIKAAMYENINVNQLEVVNESHLHSGHSGDDGSGQTHFKLMIESLDFENISRLEAQRMVNTALAGCFEEGLHAISIHTKPIKK